MPHDLLAVHGNSSGLVVAVGANGRILMFGGSRYEPFPVASPTRATLRGVWVESPSSAWAVGDGGVVLRWDGHKWRHVALAGPSDSLTCIWGHPTDGIWIGGQQRLIHHDPISGSSVLVQSDVEVCSIWGTGPSDTWFLAPRAVMRWTGDSCTGDELPGDDDETWSVVAGSAPGEPVYVVGIMGLVMEWTGERWYEFTIDTDALLTGACCAGRDLYVVTDTGLMRAWDGQRWRTVAFSAFGGLNACCCVGGVLWACGDKGVVLQHQPDAFGGE